MHLFNSRADFDAQMKSVKKWMRTGQALDGVADLQHDVAYSIAIMPCLPRSMAT